MLYTARALWRLFGLVFLRRADPAWPYRARTGFAVVFFVLFPLGWLVNTLCLWLDAVVFPGLRRTRLQAPVFIIGAPRSGTTILHRVMAEDHALFFCFRTWEIALPSVLQKKAASLLGGLDRLLGGPLRRALLRAEATRFQTFQHLHQIGLFLPEEDDKLLLHILASTDLEWLFPYGTFRDLARMDVAVDSRDQRQIMDFYVQCVRRQAYVAGAGRRLLSKNPAFCGKVANLAERFPGCKFVYIARNPLESVPSTISLARAILRSTLGLQAGRDLDEMIYDTLKFYYTYPLDRLSALPDDRLAVVNYEELTHEPKRVIQRIYRQFGFTVTREFEERLERQAAMMRRHRSRHEYSLEQCSVTRERIVAELGAIFDRFGFDRGAHDAVAAEPSSSRAVRAPGPVPPPAA